jgi:hypothetical protein
MWLTGVAFGGDSPKFDIDRMLTLFKVRERVAVPTHTTSRILPLSLLSTRTLCFVRNVLRIRNSMVSFRTRIQQIIKLRSSIRLLETESFLIRWLQGKEMLRDGVFVGDRSTVIEKEVIYQRDAMS